jgi:O-acetyl-ADP-ribose deacetylase (regulator of RNase III)
VNHGDGAIHRAAENELLQECKKIRNEILNGNYLPTGKAVITKRYNLPAKYVIHTVGPVWSGNTKNEEELLAN